VGGKFSTKERGGMEETKNTIKLEKKKKEGVLKKQGKQGFSRVEKVGNIKVNRDMDKNWERGYDSTRTGKSSVFS